MNCDDVCKLIDAYLDTELDLVTSLSLESHLAECPSCAQRLRHHQVVRSALQSEALYYRAPANLQRQVRATPGVVDRVRRTPWLGLVATFLVGALVTVGLLRTLAAPDAFTAQAQEVVASHIRSLMVDHLSDVASTDQHTVKPWFNGKLDFSPTVVDPTQQGFPLIGGRLDYLDNRAVTALVYQRQKHIINLFEWPSLGAADSGIESITLQGYHALHWVKASVSYWAVSDVEIGELQAFVQLIQGTAPAPS